MAFRRDIEIDIISNNSLITQITELDMEFDIERTIELANNTAKAIIYNAKEQTRKDIIKVGNNIIIKAGYKDEGNKASVFFGTITDVSSQLDDTTWKSEIIAKDIGNNKDGYKAVIISYSYIANTPVVQLINDIAAAINIPVFGIENASGRLQAGLSYTGTIQGLLKKVNNILTQQGTGIYFDSSQMILYKLGQQDSKFGVVRITPESGLIGEVEEIIEEQEQDNKKRLKITSLLNPKITPNSLIQLDSEKEKGLYIVEKVQFIGDTLGGDFFTIAEVVE